MTPLRRLLRRRPRRLFFLHIPKTAGTAVRFAIGDEYDDGEIVWIYPGMDWAMSFDELRELPPETRADARIVFGHMPYGGHEHFEGPFTYTTILRDPTRREVSRFAHQVRNKNRKLARGSSLTALESAVDTGEVGLREFLMGKGPAGLVRNHMTRIIAGHPPGVSHDDPALLDIALDHIERHFLGVGFTENLQAFADAIGPSVGWPDDLTVGRMNVTEGRVDLDPPGPAELDLIQEITELDRQLYDHVWELTEGGTRLIGGRGR